MKEEIQTLNDWGCKVLEVVEGTDYPRPRSYAGPDSLVDYYSYQIKTHEIRHRVIAGYDDTYVVLFSQHDVRKLEQKIRDYEYMTTLYTESQKVLQEDAKERKIRNSNAGVAEAYEHYKFMLNLAK